MMTVGSVSGAQADAIDFGAAFNGAVPYSAIDGSGFSGTLSTPCPAVTARVRPALNPIRQRRLGYRTVAQAPERSCSENSLGIDFGRVGSLGGAASASSSATFSGMGNAPASANASGGPGGAIVNDEVGAANGGGAGPSGAAAAQSAAQNASGSGTTTERSPAAPSLTGGAAGGVAAVGAPAATSPPEPPSPPVKTFPPPPLALPTTLVPIAAGPTHSNAALTPGGSTSACKTTGDFSFAAAAPEELILTRLDNNPTSLGFAKLKFEVTVDGTILDTFTSLSVAEALFADHRLDFRTLCAKDLVFDISTLLAASGLSAGFESDNSTVPEPSTWAMMLIGFAGLGFAGYRRTRKGHAKGNRVAGGRGLGGRPGACGRGRRQPVHPWLADQVTFELGLRRERFRTSAATWN
jgi:PEP-CTERM motif-containing protein